MQKMDQFHWYEILPLIPTLIIFVPSIYSVLLNPYGRVTLNFILFTMNFQSLTIVLTCVLFTAVYHLLFRRIKFMDRIILTVTTTVLATHYYEMIHAISQLLVTGNTGMTLWILNIPVVIGLLLFLYFNGRRKHKVLSMSIFSVVLFSISVATMMCLGSLGFFSDMDAKGAIWALSKISCYVMFIPLFIGGKKNKY